MATCEQDLFGGFGTELVSKQTRRKIYLNVLSGHIIFLMLPVIFYYIQSLFPEEKIIKINLVDPGPPEKSMVEKAVEKAKEPVKDPEPEPVPAEPVVKDLPPPEPAPAEPQVKELPPPEPVPAEPVVKALPAPPKEPTIKPIKVKDNIKEPVPKPVEKTAVVPPKTEKKGPLKPDQIKISKDVVKGRKPTPPTPVFNSGEFIKGLKSAVKQQTSASSSSSRAPTGAVSAEYYDQVSSYLYRLWRQPMKSLLGGKTPQVKILLKIDGSGRVLSARIVSASGISAMDESVSELLSRLKTIPAPPDGKADEIAVSMEIADD